jgi:hypothetical protein
VFVAGSGDMYKCATQSGASSYFNVRAPATGRFLQRECELEFESGPAGALAKAATPSGFPRVDAGIPRRTRRLRRKVLAQELAAEEKLLSESGRARNTPMARRRRSRKKGGRGQIPVRIARLKQTVSVHERNVEALKRSSPRSGDASEPGADIANVNVAIPLPEKHLRPM